MKFSIFSLFVATALAAPSALAPSPEVAALAPISPEALARFNAKEVVPNGVVPAEAVNTATEKRAITHLYFCQNAGFGQPCQNFELQTGTCCEYNGCVNI